MLSCKKTLKPIRTMPLNKVTPRPKPRLHGGSRPKGVMADLDVFWPAAISSMYFASKSVILFTGFYCGLQWLHYQKLQKDLEDDD